MAPDDADPTDPTAAEPTAPATPALPEPARPAGVAGVAGAAGAAEQGRVEEQDGVGEQDAFERLWTPHRMAYIKGEGKPSTEEECPFCRAPEMSDEDGLVLARGEVVYAVLNLYPYNSGHLMAVPYRHVADYTELSTVECAELALFTQRAMATVRKVSGAHGFNIGMNQGTIAGAGIAAHLHQHVVPRWGGDTNFMPIVGHTRVLPQLLADTRALLAEAWER